MTQMQLERQVARITGEPLLMIIHLGFSVMSQQPDEVENQDVQLVLDCPFCGRPVPYPGHAGDGSETMAECDSCDVYFCFDPDEVYTIKADTMSGQPD